MNAVLCPRCLEFECSCVIAPSGDFMEDGWIALRLSEKETHDLVTNLKEMDSRTSEIASYGIAREGPNRFGTICQAMGCFTCPREWISNTVVLCPDHAHLCHQLEWLLTPVV